MFDWSTFKENFRKYYAWYFVAFIILSMSIVTIIGEHYKTHDSFNAFPSREFLDAWSINYTYGSVENYNSFVASCKERFMLTIKQCYVDTSIIPNGLLCGVQEHGGAMLFSLQEGKCYEFQMN